MPHKNYQLIYADKEPQNIKQNCFYLYKKANHWHVAFLDSNDKQKNYILTEEFDLNLIKDPNANASTILSMLLKRFNVCYTLRKPLDTPPTVLGDNQFVIYPIKNVKGWKVSFENEKNEIVTLDADDELMTLIKAQHPSKSSTLASRELLDTIKKDENNTILTLIHKRLLQLKKRAEQPMRFDYAEHVSIGESVKHLFNQQFPEGIKLSESKTILKNGIVKLNDGKKEDGQSIALSEFCGTMGDFFGLPDAYIASGANASERLNLFKNHFATFEGEMGAKKVKDVLLIGSIQKQALQIAQENCEHTGKDCDCAKKALEETSSLTNQLWNKVTGGAFYLYPLFNGDYLELSKNNVDHFGDSAKLAYEAGHNAALACIKRVAEEMKKGESKDINLIARNIQLAVAYQAAADHFLTDLFSSGHLRVPRKELYELTSLGLPVPSAITGLFTLVMHNEDGEQGLTVTDKLTQEQWQAYGDDSLLTSKGKNNRVKVCTAARIGMLEVIGELKKALGHAYDPDQYPTIGTVKKLFPEEVENKNNSKPLFKKNKNGNLLRRKDVNNAECNEYIDNWWVGNTLMLLLPQAYAYAFPNSTNWPKALYDILAGIGEWFKSTSLYQFFYPPLYTVTITDMVSPTSNEEAINKKDYDIYEQQKKLVKKQLSDERFINNKMPLNNVSMLEKLTSGLQGEAPEFVTQEVAQKKETIEEILVMNADQNDTAQCAM